MSIFRKSVSAISAVVILGTSIPFYSFARMAEPEVDREAPVLTLPANIVQETDAPLSAFVEFSASARDNIDGVVSVECTPSAGTFNYGITTVSCSAADRAGNRVSGTFTITLTDTIDPTVTITINNTYFNIADTTADVTFTFSEIPSEFDMSDVIVKNGTLDALVASENPRVYSAIFTADADIEDPSNLIIVGTNWSDAVGNSPSESTSSEPYFIDTEAPQISIVQSEEQLDPTTNPRVNFVVVTNESVYFRESALSCNNFVVTNGVCNNVERYETDKFYTVSVTATGPGLIIVSVYMGEDGEIYDQAGNIYTGNPALKGEADNVVLYGTIVGSEGSSKGGGGSVVFPDVNTPVQIVTPIIRIVDDSSKTSDKNSDQDDELICKGSQKNGNWYRKCEMSTLLAGFEDFTQNLICEGFISDKNDAQPQITMLRKEVSVLAVNMTKKELVSEELNSFNDISSTEQKIFINTAQSHKLVTTARKSFEPEREVSRSEAYAMIMSSVCMLTPTDSEDDWQQNVFETASNLGLTTRKWTDFEPNRSILTQEIYLISARAADWAEQTGGCNPKPAECLVENA